MPAGSITPVIIEIDGRGMQPPEPLEHTLTALDTLPPHGEVVLKIYCQPHPLFNILRNNGFVWQEITHDDGTHEVRIRHAAEGPY